MAYRKKGSVTNYFWLPLNQAKSRKINRPTVRLREKSRVHLAQKSLHTTFFSQLAEISTSMAFCSAHPSRIGTTTLYISFFLRLVKIRYLWEKCHKTLLCSVCSCIKNRCTALFRGYLNERCPSIKKKTSKKAFCAATQKVHPYATHHTKPTSILVCW
jgi:hypothetical protein